MMMIQVILVTNVIPNHLHSKLSPASDRIGNTTGCASYYLDMVLDIVKILIGESLCLFRFLCFNHQSFQISQKDE